MEPRLRSSDCSTLKILIFLKTTHDKATSGLNNILTQQHSNLTTFRLNNSPTQQRSATTPLLAFLQRVIIFFNRPRTTRSCRHKALLSRRGPDTIEEDLAGLKARLTLPQALGRSHKCFLQCVRNMLCPKYVVSECRYV